MTIPSTCDPTVSIRQEQLAPTELHGREMSDCHRSTIVAPPLIRVSRTPTPNTTRVHIRTIFIYITPVVSTTRGVDVISRITSRASFSIERILHTDNQTHHIINRASYIRLPALPPSGSSAFRLWRVSSPLVDRAISIVSSSYPPRGIVIRSRRRAPHDLHTLSSRLSLTSAPMGPRRARLDAPRVVSSLRRAELVVKVRRFPIRRTSSTPEPRGGPQERGGGCRRESDISALLPEIPDLRRSARP